MKYNLFIGRYQSPHKGHMAIFDEYLSRGLPVLIAIRDVVPDDANPLSASDIKELWEAVYKENPLVRVIVLPDIGSVNYGRGVGYEVREIPVAAQISAISATEIRRQILAGEDDWKAFVDAAIHGLLQKRLHPEPGLSVN